MKRINKNNWIRVNDDEFDLTKLVSITWANGLYSAYVILRFEGDQTIDLYGKNCEIFENWWNEQGSLLIDLKSKTIEKAKEN